MNWKSIAFDWNQARAFLATAEEGSLSAAARALGLTQPTLGRQVTALEESLGVVLFERRGRSLLLTQSGQELLEHVRRMAEAAGEMSLSAAGHSQAVEGKISITASDMAAAYYLPPVLMKLHAMAPALQVEVVASNALQDIRRREADIAIRHVRPDQPDLIARLVREQRARFYASPSYLQRYGRPKTLADMAQAKFVGMEPVERMLGYFVDWGMPVTLDNFSFSSESGIVAWEMAKLGLGITVMSEDMARMTPGMERVLPEMEPFTFPTWLATHRELHTSRKIRLVFDLLAEELSRPVQPMAA